MFTSLFMLTHFPDLCQFNKVYICTVYKGSDTTLVHLHHNKFSKGFSFLGW